MFEERFDELGSNHLDRMPKGLELALPVKCAGAGFDTNLTNGYVVQLGKQSFAPDPLLEHGIALSINAVKPEHALRQIEISTPLSGSQFREHGPSGLLARSSASKACSNAYVAYHNIHNVNICMIMSFITYTMHVRL